MMNPTFTSSSSILLVLLIIASTTINFMRKSVVDAWSVLPIAPITPVVPPAATGVVVESQAADIMIQAAYLLTRTTKTTSLADNIKNWSKINGTDALALGVPPANAFEIDEMDEAAAAAGIATATTTTTVTVTATGPQPPTKEEILTLQKAFSAFYGPSRSPSIALPLFDDSIQSFERSNQPADERAGLYRVRGDCKMTLSLSQEAINDYTIAIDLLKLPESIEKADPIELPASLLGRARAIRSLGPKQITDQQAAIGVEDYKQTLILNARDDYDTIQEQIEDGAKTNPYAAWEYGMALRQNSQYAEAKIIHLLTSDVFDSISDRSRSVISLLDAGIDAACQEIVSGGKVSSELSSSSDNYNDNNKNSDAKSILKKAVQYTTTAEGRDVALLQRVVAKEGEGRVVLAALEWSDKSLRNDAEQQLSTACERLDQLEQDGLQRMDAAANKKATPGASSSSTITSLRFNIDDYPGALEASCSRFKNTDFQTERLEWPTILQDKTQRLLQLK
ncbi:hypothetical protein FRACYDRAFT_238504 [Fragilariopsis cylindrus CCMP1102]|uniref:Uncharacterized protein n=1 Tax=Fragilariopsis cylindrus CCMP1102 TaxID=635003 RepID=A0A1E7FIR7_9STRA|nr:hypothetical protein FRACYDRAFT_238504 [Fragilariopsis cylindrus CCMP1102]|eukprot:OEU18071.1 hypothetical protein FRACYDRAFT_238504 [Fragilariopsis cylindrus CCMP1102]